VKTSQWDARIQRAEKLIPACPFAAEGLRFYLRVACFQRTLYSDVRRALANSQARAFPDFLRGELEHLVLLPKFAGFLAMIEQSAPGPLAQAARTEAQRGSARWKELLQDFWLAARNDGRGDERMPASAALERVLAWIFLQPYAEYLSSLCGSVIVNGTPFSCPICGAKPIVAVLRPEGDGAKKSLVCMLCAHEWAFRRVYCPACGEEREPQMAFYSAPEIPHVRVDVCDTCHTYLKAVDLTKSGLAVPVVDELAAIPLDLWAGEHGYHKLQMNLLGT